jgi:hypothetical protein
MPGAWDPLGLALYFPPFGIVTGSPSPENALFACFPFVVGRSSAASTLLRTISPHFHRRTIRYSLPTCWLERIWQLPAANMKREHDTAKWYTQIRVTPKRHAPALVTECGDDKRRTGGHIRRSLPQQCTLAGGLRRVSTHFILSNRRLWFIGFSFVAWVNCPIPLHRVFTGFKSSVQWAVPQLSIFSKKKFTTFLF